MVIYAFNAEPGEKLIKALSGGSFEESIGIALCPNSVDYMASFVVGVHHLVHCVDIVLTVGVYGYGNIAKVPCFHKTCQQSVLVAAVAALSYACEV